MIWALVSLLLACMSSGLLAAAFSLADRAAVCSQLVICIPSDPHLVCTRHITSATRKHTQLKQALWLQCATAIATFLPVIEAWRAVWQVTVKLFTCAPPVVPEDALLPRKVCCFASVSTRHLRLASDRQAVQRARHEWCLRTQCCHARCSTAAVHVTHASL